MKKLHAVHTSVVRDSTKELDIVYITNIDGTVWTGLFWDDDEFEGWKKLDLEKDLELEEEIKL